MRYSTLGRPRRVTDANIAEILAWADSRMSCQQLADRLGLSIETVRKIIQSRGQHYKSQSPEQRPPSRRRGRRGRQTETTDLLV